MQHAEIGAAILANLNVDEDVIKAIRHLHEWWNGEGYPDGLRGEEIPTAAAILAVADAYDTLTLPGPHGEARTPTEAVQEILRRSGQQFSPMSQPNCRRCWNGHPRQHTRYRCRL